MSTNSDDVKRYFLFLSHTVIIKIFHKVTFCALYLHLHLFLGLRINKEQLQ